MTTGSRGNPDASSDLLLGRTLGNYRIQSLKGTGANGTVFLAEHVMLQQPVALKVLHGALLEHDETVARFQREAQTTAALNHPNICNAMDFGRLPDGSFYFVMEYLDGQTLQELNRSFAPLDPQIVMHISRQIASALATAHEQNIVHRDLKPENVMLLRTPDDPYFVKLMDFGLAHLLPEDESQSSELRLTAAGVVYGTPAYLSPEQALAERVDERSDLYGLGAMMFEMLTGDLPYKGSNIVQVLKAHVVSPIPSVIERNPGAGIPGELDVAIQTLMAKQPEDRFASAQDFIDALDAISLPDHEEVTHVSTSVPSAIMRDVAALTEEPPAAPETEPIKVVSSTLSTQSNFIALLQERPRWQLGAALGAFVAVIVVTLFVFSGPGPKETPPPPQDPELRAQHDADILSRTLAEERDAFVKGAEGVRQALDAMVAGDHDQASEKLDALAPQHESSPHFHYYLGLARDGSKSKVKAIDAFSVAIKLDERYARDNTVRDALIEAYFDKKSEVQEHARAALTDPLLDQYTLHLGALAYEHRSRRGRKRARALLEETQRWEKLPAWRQHAIELKHSKGCKTRAQIIARLAKTDSPRALEPLREYASRPKKGCGKRKRDDCYGCIRDDLQSAIDTLEAKFPEANAQ